MNVKQASGGSSSSYNYLFTYKLSKGDLLGIKAANPSRFTVSKGV